MTSNLHSMAAKCNCIIAAHTDMLEFYQRSEVQPAPITLAASISEDHKGSTINFICSCINRIMMKLCFNNPVRNCWTVLLFYSTSASVSGFSSNLEQCDLPAKRCKFSLLPRNTFSLVNSALQAPTALSEIKTLLSCLSKLVPKFASYNPISIQSRNSYDFLTF